METNSGSATSKDVSGFGKVTLVADTAIITAPVSNLKNGDVILVPGKGKRGVRTHSNGKLSLVFPRSGAIEVDGKSAGKLSDLGGHDAAVVGYVTGGWASVGTSVPNAGGEAPKASVKGSQAAKDKMAAVRAARKSSTHKEDVTPKAKRSTAPKVSSNQAHFANALSALATAIDELQHVSFD